jgi:hypothetical protein
MFSIKDRWDQLPRRRRLVLLALATAGMAMLATILLVRGGLKEVLYKGF